MSEHNQTPEQPQGQGVKHDVLTEVASGYTLGATIMSFLAIWSVAVWNLSSQGLV